MPSFYDPTNWYWKVGDSNPTTQRFASVTGTYVLLADAAYVTWLAADGGNTPTTIDTHANLAGVLDGVVFIHGRGDGVTITEGAIYTMTNPPPWVFEFDVSLPDTGAGSIIKLPPQNDPDSLPLGSTITFVRADDGDTRAVTISMSDGTPIHDIDAGDSLHLIPVSNETTAGEFVYTIDRREPLAMDHGGTAQVAGGFVSHGVVYKNTSNALESTAAGTNGQLLVGQTGAAPEFKAISADVTFAASGAATVASATTSAAGKVELATDAETITGTDTARAMTPSNLTAFFANGQLAFPATQNPSAGANVLDDYEEGDWTPADASGASLAFTSVAGKYTKVGRQVHINGRVTYPATANGSSAVIGGLPFAALTSNNGYIVFCANTTPRFWLTDAAATTGSFYTSAGANVTNAQMSGVTVVISATYFV